ncbi:DUF6428 family protein [Cytophaga hutchinsonii]|nr:DUF6428 family protein [Cytophaga hutchinsonii]
MKLSEIKKHLKNMTSVSFELEDGMRVPEHFHITEVGVSTKDFIDCGGTVRHEKAVNFQLWQATDFEHRLLPDKLLDIITLSEKVLGIEDLDVEVEYQLNTIGKYGIAVNGNKFILTSKHTACLAGNVCGIPEDKQNIPSAAVNTVSKGSCTPGGGCC